MSNHTIFAGRILTLGLLLAMLAACTPVRDATAPGAESYRIVGYVFGNRNLDFRRLGAHKLTHINYAFANVVDGAAQLVGDDDAANLARLQALKAHHPALKILVSIGGWAWSENFSDAALTDTSRARFARSAVDLLNTYALDGIDVDWEYPGQQGEDNVYRPEDRQHFTLMLKALREHLDAQGAQDGRTGADRYLLTIATGASATYLEHTELGEAQRYLDFVNIMTYDFAGSWSETTGHHTNLYPSKAAGAPARAASTEVERHLQAGVPARKLVLGVAFYGRGWAGVHNAQDGLFQSYTRATQGFSFQRLRAEFVDKNGYRRHWDDAARAPYLWHPDSTHFITYDDEESLRHKTDFVKARGLGGVMYWQHGSDPDERLLDVLYRHLR